MHAASKAPAKVRAAGVLLKLKQYFQGGPQVPSWTPVCYETNQNGR